MFGQSSAPDPRTGIPVPSISWAVLRDSGYNLPELLTDPRLPFRPGDSIRQADGQGVWVRIVVGYPEGNTEAYRLRLLPNLGNKVYQRSQRTDRIVLTKSGLRASSDASREKNSVSLQFRTGGADTVLVHMQIPAGLSAAFRPQLSIEPEAVYQAREAALRLIWVVALSILALLLILNTCVYFGFRDRAILLYLPVQVGAMAFVTAARRFFDLLLPAAPFSSKLFPDGRLFVYNWNSVCMHLGVLVMVYGIVQFSRRYLDLRRLLPRQDRALRVLLWIYCGVTLLGTGLSLAGFYVDITALFVENVFVFLIVCAVLYAGGAAYRRNRPVATTFLVASGVPVTLVLALTLLHLLVHSQAEGPMLPYLAIISQAICFFLMILVRIRQLINEVAVKRREADRLSGEIGAIETHRLELMADHAHISEEIGSLRARHATVADRASALQQQLAEDAELRRKLEDQLSTNQRMLASTSLQLLQKNELLASLKSEIEALGKGSAAAPSHLKTVSSILQHDLYLDQDWNKFKVHFEQVHPDFFADLAARHPALTRNEIRLYTYFHMNLSTKEIAALLNIEPGSVRRAKTRLYKKIGRTDDEPLASDAEAAGDE